MTLSIIGAGAFGTALGVAMSEGLAEIRLWARDPDQIANMQETRQNVRLPGVALPEPIRPIADIDAALSSDVILLAIPAQKLSGFLQAHKALLNHKILVAACKGIDLETMTGPVGTIHRVLPDARAAILTGPSFAADIARGLPTALTLACADESVGAALQSLLSTSALRLYRTTDTIGAELGGALKNVMAIAAGACAGAGLGDSARAALITRGMAEMQRLALQLGGRAETLAGLSGFGDLVLTCTSTQSRNYQFGLALGQGNPFDASITVEGVATAKAVSKLAEVQKMDLPITEVVAALVTEKISVAEAMQNLLSRPLKEE